MAQQPLASQGLLIIQASRSNSDTPHKLGIPWYSDLLDAETSTAPDRTQQSDTNGSGGFELAIAATERPHIYALDRAATGIGEH